MFCFKKKHWNIYVYFLLRYFPHWDESVKHYLISPKPYSYNHQHGSIDTGVPCTSYLRLVDLGDPVWFWLCGYFCCYLSLLLVPAVTVVQEHLWYLNEKKKKNNNRSPVFSVFNFAAVQRYSVVSCAYLFNAERSCMVYFNCTSLIILFIGEIRYRCSLFWFITYSYV